MYTVFSMSVFLSLFWRFLLFISYIDQILFHTITMRQQRSGRNRGAEGSVLQELYNFLYARRRQVLLCHALCPGVRPSVRPLPFRVRSIPLTPFKIFS